MMAATAAVQLVKFYFHYVACRQALVAQLVSAFGC